MTNLPPVHCSVVELRQYAMRPPTADGRNDFHFLHGRWVVRHRKLRERLAGCTGWDLFDGRCEAWPLMGGLGNVDDNVMDGPGLAYRAATMRAFDPKDRCWRLWWLDGRWPTVIDTPMVGRFEGGVGTFFADEDFHGRPIRVRFLWLHTQTPTPRWEQAFSTDGGRTWETSWQMDFERAA